METDVYVRLFGENHAEARSDSAVYLDLIGDICDGFKLRGRNTVRFPVRALPKVVRVIPKEHLKFDNLAIQKLNNIVNEIKERKRIIKECRDQYAGEIEFDYNCRGVYKPMKHQMIMYNIMTKSRVAAILSDPGTCKTAAYLWAIDKRIERGEVKKALIITLSYLKRNVLEELEKQIPHRKGIVLDGKVQSEKVLKKTFKKESKNIDYDIYIANYESMFSLVEMFSDDYFQLVVLDEAHRIGSPCARQTKTIVAKFEFTPYKYIVSGTIHANSSLSFFMPFRFLGPDVLPSANFYHFRRANFYEYPPGTNIWREAPNTKQLVASIVSNVSVFFKKEQCLDLPPIIYETRFTKLTSEQSVHYSTVMSDFYASIDDICGKCIKKNECTLKTCDSTILIKNALVAVSKLSQITAGFMMFRKADHLSAEDKDSVAIVKFEENPKLNLLMDVILGIPQDRKIIIWCNFVYGIDLIAERLAAAYGGESFITVSGSGDAYSAAKRFEEDSAVRFFVSNPQKSGAGLNLQFEKSNYQIFYSNNYSYVMRDQAEGRQYRQGQNEKVTVIDLLCKDTIDEKIRKVLMQKKRLGGDLSVLASVLDIKRGERHEQHD